MQLRNTKTIGLQVDEDNCTCAICMEIKYEPIIINPCGHSFCDPCIRKVANTAAASNSVTNCPLCRTEIIECNTDYVLRGILVQEYPREYQERHKAENMFPVPYPLPRKMNWYELNSLKLSMKNILNAIDYLFVIKTVVTHVLFFNMIGNAGVCNSLLIGGLIVFRLWNSALNAPHEMWFQEMIAAIMALAIKAIGGDLLEEIGEVFKLLWSVFKLLW